MGWQDISKFYPERIISILICLTVQIR